ncbi:NAD-dependent epimerase/dehydratase family protein [Sphingobacterium mizutaii]|uniref:NAD-dependent epimerase/dehydratase family protein n=1 Tax=Sphingobacterium mizutaii TaxID=1010 RepID=UPI001623CD6E|nr:NAD-dependent epimerase/dehydratase family protein [Sphingobacterium mizutaii]
MKILVTGASGFVGQNLIDYLKRYPEVEVEIISLRNPKWIDVELNDYNAIIHLAGKAHDTSNTEDDSSYFEINRDLTIKLFKKFKDSNVKDLLYFSSVKAVADSVEGILTENVLPNPITPYGRSKMEAENFLISEPIKDDQRVFILRPCMIHGPGNKGNLNLLFNVVQKGLPWPLGAFHNERSFLSIDNLSFLIYQILNNNTLKSNVYNLADDEFVSTNQLVDLISKVLGKKSKLLNINTSIIKNLVKIGDVLPLPLNSERLKKLTESYCVSNDKIKADLKLNNLPTSAIDGLTKTLQSFSR